MCVFLIKPNVIRNTGSFLRRYISRLHECRRHPMTADARQYGPAKVFATTGGH